MSQSIENTDLETLELYLDRELGDADVARVEARLVSEPALRSTLDRLRRQRAVRLEAMSTAFDTDAASVERLIASVRSARADEVAARRAWWRPNPSYFAAAASLAFGLILGVQLQRQHMRPGDSQVATPVAAVGSARPDTSVVYGPNGVRGHGAYVVSLTGSDGRERMRIRFNSAEQGQEFIRMVNRQPGNAVRASPVADDPF
jgi:anti-sigma factor RsiW